MRTLTFNSQEGDFYLDQFEDIGDFIEVTDIESLRTKRVQGKACYRFRLLLKFSCNKSKPEYVEFYTFYTSIRYLLIELSEAELDSSLMSTRDVGKNNYTLEGKKLSYEDNKKDFNL